MEPWSAPADLPVTVTFLILLFLLARVPSMSRGKAPSALGTEPGTHSFSFRNHCPNLERCEHQKSFVRKHEGKNAERNISSRRIRLQKSGASGGSPRSHRCNDFSQRDIYQQMMFTAQALSFLGSSLRPQTETSAGCGVTLLTMETAPQINGEPRHLSGCHIVRYDATTGRTQSLVPAVGDWTQLCPYAFLPVTGHMGTGEQGDDVGGTMDRSHV